MGLSVFTTNPIVDQRLSLSITFFKVTECPGISAGDVDAFALGYSLSSFRLYWILRHLVYQVAKLAPWGLVASNGSALKAVVGARCGTVLVPRLLG